MNYFIPKSLYACMDSALLLRLLQELGRQGTACRLVLDILAHRLVERRQAA
jgi:hypothetical protein